MNTHPGKTHTDIVDLTRFLMSLTPAQITVVGIDTVKVRG